MSKVLLINGSPHAHGCTFTALSVVADALEQNGRSSESHPSLLEDGRVVTDEGKANKQPEWQEGKFIWTRSQITWTDNTVTYTSPVLAKAINGANESAEEAKKAVTTLDESLNQQAIFNRLTNNGQTQGIYLENGKETARHNYIYSE